MTTDLVVNGAATDLDRVEEMRLAIRNIDNIAHAMEAADQSKAIDVYARAKKSRDLITQAIRLRLFAERRAGELARESGKSFRELMRDFSVTNPEVRRWVSLSMFDDDQIDKALAGIEDKETSYHAVYQSLIVGSAKRVEPGIYEMSDGRFQFKWKRGGRQYSRTVGSLKAARRGLLNVRGIKLDAKSPSVADLDLSRSYSSLRVALDNADSSIPHLTGTARDHVQRAITLMHKAEDELIAARSLVT